jgi:flagellar basal-body rod protein FlgB
MSITRNLIEDATVDALERFLNVDVARYKLVSANVANIDTPGYRTRDLDFRGELMRAGAQAGAQAGGWNEAGLSYASYGNLSPAAYTPVVRSVRGLMERPDGNNVSLERESLLLADAQMKYNLGVQLLKDEFHGISQAINSGGAS